MFCNCFDYSDTAYYIIDKSSCGVFSGIFETNKNKFNSMG